MSSADKAPGLQHGRLLRAQREPAVPARSQRRCPGRFAPPHEAVLAFPGQTEGPRACRAGSRVAWALFPHRPKAPGTSSSAREQADGRPGCGKPAAACPAMPPRACGSVTPGRPPSPASPQIFCCVCQYKTLRPLRFTQRSHGKARAGKPQRSRCSPGWGAGRHS